MPIAGVAVSLLVDDVTESDRERIIANVRRIASKLSARMGADLDGGTRPEPKYRETVKSE